MDTEGPRAPAPAKLYCSGAAPVLQRPSSPDVLELCVCRVFIFLKAPGSASCGANQRAPKWRPSRTTPSVIPVPEVCHGQTHQGRQSNLALLDGAEGTFGVPAVLRMLCA